MSVVIENYITQLQYGWNLSKKWNNYDEGVGSMMAAVCTARVRESNCYGKYNLKRFLLRDLLNACVEVICLILRGSEFHFLSAAALNAPSPTFHWMQGATRGSLSCSKHLEPLAWDPIFNAQTVTRATAILFICAFILSKKKLSLQLALLIS